MVLMDNFGSEHYCENINTFPLDKFLQKGKGRGKRLLIVGESPAPNGWRKSGKACYTPTGNLLPTGRRLNELLGPYGLSVETCGFTELVKCHVGKDRKLLPSCCEKCWPIFVGQVELLNSKLLLLLGVKTLEMFNLVSRNSLEIGKIAEIKLGNGNYWILPIYHPSPINPHGREKNQSIFKSVESVFREIL